MQWFNNLKVSMKVFISCFIFLLGIVVISILGITTLRSANEDFAGFYSNRFVPASQLNGIMTDFLHIRVNMGIEQAAAEQNDWNLVNRGIEESKKYGADYQDLWEKV